MKDKRNDYFPNTYFKTFEEFVKIELGYTRQWASDYVKSGKIYRVLLKYNDENEEKDQVELPTRITFLKCIPFDGSQNDKENVIEIWKIALKKAEPFLPTTKFVKIARDTYYERSKMFFIFLILYR